MFFNCAADGKSLRNNSMFIGNTLFEIRVTRKRWWRLVAALVFALQCIIAIGDSWNDLVVDKTSPENKLSGESIDNPDKEWCYLLESTTVIGMPFANRPVQLTYDGSIFNFESELCFFYGDGLKPILTRQIHFLDGWIPVAQDSWSEGGVTYKYECFSSALKPPRGGKEAILGTINTIQFAKLSAVNNSKQPQSVTLASAVRGCAGYYRRIFGKPLFQRQSVFNFDNNMFVRDGGFLAAFQPGATCYAIPGQPYTAQFTAKDFEISPKITIGIHVYTKKLAPGESFSITARAPAWPIDARDTQVINTVTQADYDAERAKTIKFWNGLFAGKTEFRFPEKRVQDSYKASLVNLILATRQYAYYDRSDNKIKLGEKHQGSGLPYDSLFLNDYFDMRSAYDAYGFSDFVEVNSKWLKKACRENGMFLDNSLSHGQPILASHGQALYSLAHHYIMTGNAKYAEDVYPCIKKGADWILEDSASHQNGLLRPSIPYDNEMIKGCYTSHNLHALLGLTSAIRVARALGKTEDVKRWEKGLERYRAAVLKALDWTFKKRGYIATGLYDFYCDNRARRGFAKYRLDQDWENNMLVFPNEVLAPNDPKVITTLDYIRNRKYREGVMTYRNGMHIHEYITLNQAHQYLAAGYQKKALFDFYNVLVHNSSTHAGFENLVVPWTRRVRPSCPPPHAWAAAKTAFFIRNMMIYSFGGNAGLDESKRELHMFNLISPCWAKPGNELEIKNARTEFGIVNAKMLFTPSGAEIVINPNFVKRPRRFVLRIPFFVTNAKIAATDGKATLDGNNIFLSPDTRKISLSWTINPNTNKGTFQSILKEYRCEYPFVNGGEESYSSTPKSKPFILPDEEKHPPAPLSFELFRRAFKKEFYRRMAEKDQAVEVEAPNIIRDKKLIEKLYIERFGRESKAENAIVTCSSEGHQENTKAANAIDGDTSERRGWFSNVRKNAWLKLDLRGPKKVAAIKVFAAYGKNRKKPVRYTIDISNDGKTWRTIVDMSENKTPPPKNGYTSNIKPATFQFLKFNLICPKGEKPPWIREIQLF